MPTNWRAGFNRSWQIIAQRQCRHNQPQLFSPHSRGSEPWARTGGRRNGWSPVKRRRTMRNMLRFIATVIAVMLLIQGVARAQEVMPSDRPDGVAADLPDADAVISPRHPAPISALSGNGAFEPDSIQTRAQSTQGSQSQTTRNNHNRHALRNTLIIFGALAAWIVIISLSVPND